MRMSLISEKITHLIQNLLYECQLRHQLFNFANVILNLYTKFQYSSSSQLLLTWTICPYQQLLVAIDQDDYIKILLKNLELYW